MVWAKSKNSRRWQLFPFCHDLHGAGDLIGTEAPRAHIDMAGRAVNDRLDTADVGLPGAVGSPMRVGDLDTEGNTLSANIALCHIRTSSIHYYIAPIW